MSQTRSPSIGMLIREAINARLADVHVSMPAKVVSYDSSKNTVKLQLLLKRKRRDVTGKKTVTSIPPLQNVPVAFIRTAKGWFTLPVNEGDIGMVTFCERSIKDWMGQDKGTEVEPSSTELHPLDGAWFYPGGYPSNNPIDPTNTSHVVLGTASGVEVHLGEAGLSDDQLVAIAKLVKAEISALRDTVNTNVTIFNSHLHPSGMGPTGTPASPMSSPAAVGDVKATKVKAK